ncbi:unnamed protein product [Pneumocystis jirovecii]|uniref:Uncharacterized protein n=1 Tax=Pneumocystis jirovecii TaxID=42068 RepID=L0PA47_PNEJI|nr:unnamed protein product [Pneumocystis jirovecii]
MIWLCTTGLKYIIQWYYRKVPVFWLIKGWFPYYIERIMCFPMAPIGSVSISIWFLIVNQIVSKVFLSSIKYIKKEHIRIKHFFSKTTVISFLPWYWSKLFIRTNKHGLVNFVLRNY